MLSFTQQCLLCLARAFVMNPELLCLHKPTMVYDENRSIMIMTLLRRFVVEKGLEQCVSQRQFRRPRTCIMTTSKILLPGQVDEIFTVSIKGICRVDQSTGGGSNL